MLILIVLFLFLIVSLDRLLIILCIITSLLEILKMLIS
jgi:hypothetical protein